MEDFEKRREEYYERVRNNPRLLMELEKFFKDRLLEIIITPSNENELVFASCSADFVSDIIDLEERLEDEVEELLPDQNMGLQFISTLMQKIKNNEEIHIHGVSDINNVSKDAITNENIIDLAHIVYGIAYALIIKIDESFRYIASSLDLDADNYFDIKQLIVYFNKLSKIFKTSDDSLKITDKDAEWLTVFISEFHRLCSESRILHEDEDNKAKSDRALRRSIHKVTRMLNDLK